MSTAIEQHGQAVPGPSRPGDSVPEGYVFKPHVGVQQGTSDIGLIKSCTGPGGADLWGVAADSNRGGLFMLKF